MDLDNATELTRRYVNLFSCGEFGAISAPFFQLFSNEKTLALARFWDHPREKLNCQLRKEKGEMFTFSSITSKQQN